MPVFAGIFSFLGNQVAAGNPETIYGVMEDTNSQTMALLEANFSAGSVFGSEKSEKNEAQIDENVDTLISGNALLPQATPLSGAGGAVGGDLFFDDVSVYVVRSGDTVGGIAKMFDVSVDTVLSANDLPKGAKLKAGDILLILPFSGVEHTVKKGDTLQGIANSYKVDLNDILLSNDIGPGAKLAIGEKLMIPGANISNAPKKAGTSVAWGGTSQTALKDASGYFANPVPGARRVRGITSTHRGVDLAAPTGTPIYAAAAGVVTFARGGWNGGYGGLTIVSHSNGTQTLYAHQSRLGTSVGARVSQGEVIGYVGSTGRSTGPHLHFEVKGAKNPFN